MAEPSKNNPAKITKWLKIFRQRMLWINLKITIKLFYAICQFSKA
jgi:hypothetical protein